MNAVFENYYQKSNFTTFLRYIYSRKKKYFLEFSLGNLRMVFVFF